MEVCAKFSTKLSPNEEKIVKLNEELVKQSKAETNDSSTL